MKLFIATCFTAGGDVYPDEVSHERALRYSRIRQWLVLAGMIWSGAMSVVALVTGLSAGVRSQSRRLVPPTFGPTMPYTLVVSLLSFVASLPLAYFGGFVVEHRYRLSNQNHQAWIVEELKGLAVGLVISPPLVQGVYWIIQHYPRRWWAILSALTIPFTVILANLVPVLILPLFNKFEPLRDRGLAKRIKGLAAAQGVRVSNVMQMNMSKQTKKANAFFTGFGKTKRIVLGDTLLDEFSADEVEVVLAHELGHQVHRDIWKLIGLGTLTTTAISYLTHRASEPLLRRFGARWGIDADGGAGDIAALPALALVAGGASLVFLPLQNALTRHLIEHPADRFALDLTGKGDAFVRAMEKLGRMNLSNPTPSTLIKWLMYDHPTLQERIDFGRRYVSERNGQ
ncbi:MAG: M48 family metallopeptidase [Chloroflexota bacterium]